MELLYQVCRIKLHKQRQVLVHHGYNKCSSILNVLLNSSQKRTLRTVSKVGEIRKIEKAQIEETEKADSTTLSSNIITEIKDYKEFEGERYKIYNTVWRAKHTENYFEMLRARRERSSLRQESQELLKVSDISVAASALIKEMSSDIVQDEQLNKNAVTKKDTREVQYPFAIQTNFKTIPTISSPVEPPPRKKVNSVTVVRQDVCQDVNSLIKNYEEAEKEISPEEEFDMLLIKQALYGTPNPNIPASNIPCSGCGALLHCQDPAVAGYVPSQIFEPSEKSELRRTVCQRCHFLTRHDVALAVNVSSDNYVKLLSEIKDKKALVILIVDLTDFPCSIWPGLLEIIGEDKPIVVVGNKADLLPKDEDRYLGRIKMALEKALIENGIIKGKNVKHIALISAKTGYGIEDLITTLQTKWSTKGDVYLVGCTNVGKSSLFNCLIQSDYCKVKAVDIVQRATVSRWPGTTLNLLKFPILRPSASRLYLRQRRLKLQKPERKQEENLRKTRFRETKDRNYATLIGNIGMTFYNPEFLFARGVKNPFELETKIVPKVVVDEGKAFRADDKNFRDGKWCYDTPGSIHPEQIINLLTLEELRMTLPKDLIRPKTYSVKPQFTLFLAGLGRIDYVEGVTTIRMTVFASGDLPITILPTKIADKFYEKFLGTDVFKVPFGNENRLKDFPPLEGKDIRIKGIAMGESCADIVLSSAGWVSLTPLKNMECILKAFTPASKGLYFREPSLLPFAVRLRGKRKKFTPCFENNKTLI